MSIRQTWDERERENLPAALLVKPLLRAGDDDNGRLGVGPTDLLPAVVGHAARSRGFASSAAGRFSLSLSSHVCRILIVRYSVPPSFSPSNPNLSSLSLLWLLTRMERRG